MSSTDEAPASSAALDALLVPLPADLRAFGLLAGGEALRARHSGAWMTPGLLPPWGGHRGMRGDAFWGSPALGNGMVSRALGHGAVAVRASFLRDEMPDAYRVLRRDGVAPWGRRPPLLFASHFAKLKDPRVERRKLHKLVDIVAIGLCAVICGAEGWEDMEEFGRRRERWLRDVLGLQLPNGIPGHDTFRRLFGRLEPSALNECISEWLRSLRRQGIEEIIALDGKTARHSYDTRTGQPAIHLVSAWATQSGLSLGQVKVDQKSNEITALPQLLKRLDVRGCTVTVDAMGCQKKLAQQIRDQQGHYVLALKENQEGLYEAVKLLLDDALKNDFYKNDPERRIEHDHYRIVEKDHGRIETRDCWVISGRHVAELTQAGEWAGLESLALVQGKRQIGDRVSADRHYFITSHGGKAGKIARAVREHWRVENGLHYVLDVAMDEDASDIWKDNGPENFATLRRAAVSLLRQERSSRRGVKARVWIAAMDTDYLLRVLSV